MVFAYCLRTQSDFLASCDNLCIFWKITAWCAFICAFRDLWENNSGLASFCWLLLLLHLCLAFCFLRYSEREDTKTDKTDQTDTKSRNVSFSSFSSVFLIMTDREITKKSFHAYLCTRTTGLNASNDKL